MQKRLFYFVLIGLFSLNLNAKEYECQNKYCKYMTSCDEAYYLLQICGFDNLDRDGDGVPCESICGKRGGKQSKQSKNEIKAMLKKQQAEQEQEEKTEQ